MTDYYVSRDGNNQNSGTTPGAPWKSIQKALDTLQAGDTLYIMAGTYDPGQENEDNWSINNKKGTASSKIRITNYDGGTVILSGRENGDRSGYPQNGLVTIDSVDNYHWTYTGLVEVIDCSYLVIDGIQILDTLGQGLKLKGKDGNSYAGGAKSATLKYITVQNCKIHNSRQRNMHINNAWSVTIRNCEFSFGSWAKNGGSGGPNVANGYYVYFDNNVVHQQAGEAFVVDAHNYFSRNIYVRNNVFFDCEDPILFHGVSYVICVGNYVYTTPQEQAAPKGFVAAHGSKGITVKTSECNKPVQKPVDNVLIAHNIVVNRGNGISAKTDTEDNRDDCIPGYEPQPMTNVYIVNNTMVNCDDANYLLINETASDCVIKGNISFNSGAKTHLSTSTRGNIGGWDADYNLYSSTPDIVSNLTGAHDLNNVNPQLMGTDPPSKGRVTKQSAGYYANFNLKEGYDDATNFMVKPTSPCIDAAPTITAPGSWSEMNDYLDWSYDFDNSGINPKRTGEWDIGAHEYQVVEMIQAGFNSSPRSGTAPLKVSFKDKSVSSSPITSRFWDFGDGVISTEENPVHEYGEGQFTVSLRVSSSAGTDIRTKNNLINVAAPVEPNHKRVTDGLQILYRFDEGAGDTIYDVSGVGQPLDLKISNPNAVSWLSQGIKILRSTVIVSNGPASKINEACRDSNEVSLEIWLNPRNKLQDGPARIVSISKNMHSRNITLGQGLWGTQPSNLYDLRLRTTERSANGMPSFSSAVGSVVRQKTHIVFTRKGGGRARYYINGVIAAETDIPGDFSTWNPRFPLLLGNETTGEYPWRGEVYLVAMYDRALKLSEVKQNFKAGTDLAPLMQETSAPLTTSFRRFVLVKNGSAIEAVNLNGANKAVAYGVEYPDKRCVLCTNSKAPSMAVYSDVNAVIRVYGKQGLQVSWLD